MKQLLILLLLATAGTSAAPPRHAKIFFAHMKLEGEAQERGDSTATPVGVFPVDRLVPPPVTLKVLVQHLLAGPSPAEREEGYSSGLDGMKLHLVTFDKGIATVRLKGRLNLPGVLAAPRLRLQVERTLKQISTVKQVVLIINGRADFDSLK